MPHKRLGLDRGGGGGHGLRLRADNQLVTKLRNFESRNIFNLCLGKLFILG